MRQLWFIAALLGPAWLGMPGPAQAEDKLPGDKLMAEAMGLGGAAMFLSSGAPGMVLVLVHGAESRVEGYGETAKGNATEPDGRSLLRLGSISKVFATELLAGLVVDGTLRLADPLQRFAPAWAAVPHAGERAVTLVDLATHSAGLPRETGPVPPDVPALTWPTKQQRWEFLSGYTLPWAPGTVAAYSNVSFGLLGDALETASGKDYAALLRDRITGPLGMADTVVDPSLAQCERLMTGSGVGGPAPCLSTTATEASGGLYSTGDDMAKWLRHLVATDPAAWATLSLAQAMYRPRQAMPAAIGFDEAGTMDGLGLGWVIAAAHDRMPMIVQKTGGGGGFMSYVAVVPGRQLGIFVAVSRVDFAMFSGLTGAANAMLAELAPR